MNYKTIFAILFAIICCGCAQKSDGSYKIPFVYRIDIQQGNLVEQDMIQKLEPGMDKKQVRFVLGTPLITDPFHDNRWDYIYSMEPGGGERSQRRITVYFDENEKLAYIDGDIKVNSNLKNLDELTPEDKAIVVPLKAKKEGIFDGWFSKDEPEITGTDENIETSKVTEPEKITDSPPPQVDESKVETTEPPEVTTTPIVTEDDKSTDTASSADSKPENEKKNIFQRVWDRLNSDVNDENIEQSVRDAEVLEKESR